MYAYIYIYVYVYLCMIAFNILNEKTHFIYTDILVQRVWIN